MKAVFLLSFLIKYLRGVFLKKQQQKCFSDEICGKETEDYIKEFSPKRLSLILFEEDLPYDINADVISVGKDDYLIWYIDTLDNMERYLGKTVEYTGVVAKPDYFREGCFVVGNEVMTCCEDDMQFLGFVCKYDKAEFLKEGNTVKIQCEVHCEYADEYESEGQVLYITKATSMTAKSAPKKKKKKKS